MRILQVSAEFFPLLKTGGLADVAGALPLALAAAGEDVRVLLPGFAPIAAGVTAAAPVAELTAPWGERARLLLGTIHDDGGRDLPTYLVDAPALYRRPGGPYEDAQRQPWGDNHHRFALLGWAAAQLAQGLDAGWQPELVHAHDWHAALAPAYIAHSPARGRVASVYTVHNLAYQGVFAPRYFAGLGLPDSAFGVEGVEYHGQFSFMKAGLYYADRLSTVSPTYAREIKTPAFGCGLDGLLRSRAGVLTGILNGVDDAVWNPATDTHIARNFDAARATSGKGACKAALQRELGLAEDPEAPLFVLVSRLAEQKGLPLVLEGLDALLTQGGQLALLGSGEEWLARAFTERAAAAPAQLSVTIGYDEALSHRFFAGGDVTLVPSAFEPCGLTQLYGLRYGALPLVHGVGGLADTVTDCSLENMADGSASGFVFEPFSAAAYQRALRRAFALYARGPDWRRVRASGMRRPSSWTDAARHYLTLYQQALQAP